MDVEAGAAESGAGPLAGAFRSLRLTSSRLIHGGVDISMDVEAGVAESGAGPLAGAFRSLPPRWLETFL